MDINQLLKSGRKPLIISHRGGSLIVPENTIAAYRKSIELKVDIVETDVRMTRDGYIVSFHDANLDRITGTKAELKDLTLKELIKIYPEIPTLKDVLMSCKGNVPVIIEVKEAGFEDKIIKIINEEKVLEEVIVLSFKEDIVRKVKELNPGIQVGNLVGVNLILFSAESLIRKTIDLKAGVLCLNAEGFSKSLLEECHENKILLWLWTVNNTDKMKKFIEAGVDGIITDAPDKLIHVLSR